MEVYEDDGPWMWLAFAPDSRLIVAFTIGPRKQRVADELVKLTDDCLSEKKTCLRYRWARFIQSCSFESLWVCLLYTSDAADEEDSVDLGGRRIIKKKKKEK